MKILLIHVHVLLDSLVTTARRISTNVTPILVKIVEIVLTFCLAFSNVTVSVIEHNIHVMLTDATEVPPSRGALDRIIWAIVGFAVGIAVTVVLCLLLFVCCYFTCISARKGKRKKYDVQKGKSNMFQNV